MKEIVEITLPKLGESILGATVVQWLKKEGDFVALDEAIVEVSTDKVNSEIPSPVSGILKEICVEVDEEIEVGTLLAKISTAQSSQETISHPHAVSTPTCPRSAQGKEEVFSPAVLRLAHQEGISFETLRKIQGTGDGGRVTKKDLETYLNQSRQPEPVASLGREQVERIQMTGMRKAIADNMVRSFYGAPHASLVAEVDVTEVMKMIAKEKERFKEIHGAKLTITTFLVHALAKAVQQFPMLNASLEQDTIIMKRYINVGIAVNIERGLVVPVIHNCEERSLVSIAKAIGDLSNKARTNKLSPDEIADGTITLTNFGMSGALIGVPIIRFPEVAILGAGAIQKRVVVRDDDSFAIRQMLYVTLTFDHRVIDGIYGCDFIATFKNNLESVPLL